MKTFVTALIAAAAITGSAHAATAPFMTDVADPTQAMSIDASVSGFNFTVTGFTLNDDRSNEQAAAVRFNNGTFGVKGVTGVGGKDPSGNDVAGGQNTIDGIGIDMNELLRITFDNEVRLKNLQFKGLDDFDDVFVAVTGMDGVRYSNQPNGSLNNFEELVGTSFDIMAGYPNPNSSGVGGGDTDKFALSGADVSPVPVPAALPLLAMGLGAMGFVARRRKT